MLNWLKILVISCILAYCYLQYYGIVLLSENGIDLQIIRYSSPLLKILKHSYGKEVMQTFIYTLLVCTDISFTILFLYPINYFIKPLPRLIIVCLIIVSLPVMIHMSAEKFDAPIQIHSYFQDFSPLIGVLILWILLVKKGRLQQHKIMDTLSKNKI